LMNPINLEFTLCGDAFDLHVTDRIDAPGTLKGVELKKRVTCKRCLRIIKVTNYDSGNPSRANDEHPAKCQIDKLSRWGVIKQSGI
jgi:hypothetical protein